jgi:hypothetical protein
MIDGVHQRRVTASSSLAVRSSTSWVGIEVRPERRQIRWRVLILFKLYQQ